MAISQYRAGSQEDYRRNRDCLPEIAPQGHFLALRAQGATSAVGLLAMARQEAFRILPYSFFSLQDSFISVPPPLQRTPRQGAKKAPIFRSELHVGVTYLPVQSPAKYCRRK